MFRFKSIVIEVAKKNAESADDVSYSYYTSRKGENGVKCNILKITFKLKDISNVFF